MTWSGLSTDCQRHCHTCHNCQTQKIHRRKYGKLPPKEADTDPWKMVCIDLVGPYKVTTKNKVEKSLTAMTFIDPATGWFEIAEVPDDKSSA